jgi:hypothetical protein
MFCFLLVVWRVLYLKEVSRTVDFSHLLLGTFLRWTDAIEVKDGVTCVELDNLSPFLTNWTVFFVLRSSFLVTEFPRNFLFNRKTGFRAIIIFNVIVFKLLVIPLPVINSKLGFKFLKKILFHQKMFFMHFGIWLNKLNIEIEMFSFFSRTQLP